MSERSYSDIVARLENRAETLAQTALNGRDNRLIKLLETAAQEIKTLRASLQPATPTAGEVTLRKALERAEAGLLMAEIGLQGVICPSDSETHASDIRECELALVKVREVQPVVKAALSTATGGTAGEDDKLETAKSNVTFWFNKWQAAKNELAHLGATGGDAVAGDVQAARASEPVAWRVKNHAGHWYSTTNRALAETWRTTEQLDVEALYPDLAQPSGIPDGYVLMPREATREMTMAGCDSLPSCEHVFGHAGEILRNAYARMVKAVAIPSTQQSTTENDNG